MEVIRYRERLRTPWWWYPIGIGVASLLAGEFHISGLPLTDWIPFGVLVPAAILIIWALGRGELAISDEELRIRGAHISLRYISGAVALDANTLRRVVGREGDPQAFVSIRPWIGPGVQERFDQWAVAVGASEGERGDPVEVGGGGVCAGFEEEARGFEFVEVGGPVQGGGAINLGRIYVRVLF